MRREEIEVPSSALLERLSEAHLGPARAQVDQGKSQPAVARFKDDRPRDSLTRKRRKSDAGLSGAHLLVSGEGIVAGYTARIVPAANPWSCRNLAATPSLR